MATSSAWLASSSMAHLHGAPAIRSAIRVERPCNIVPSGHVLTPVAEAATDGSDLTRFGYALRLIVTMKIVRQIDLV